MSLTETAQLEKFTLRGTQLLTSGRAMAPLASSGGLRLNVKVYAEGGENSLHAHDREEHAFFVLAGEATFTDAEGTPTVLQPYEGMMVPKDAYYMFQSSGAENLVLLRIASDVPGALPPDAPTAAGMARHSIDGGAIKNAGVPVPAPGRFFGV
jgi:mannose-6-phosphate isomerase-like protein (cupin superfamily)